MAAISSAAAGNWGTGATWTGGVVPGLADTATVNHQITVDANYSVGGIVAGTGCLLATTSQFRIAVGGGAIGFTARGLTVT